MKGPHGRICILVAGRAGRILCRPVQRRCARVRCIGGANIVAHHLTRRRGGLLLPVFVFSDVFGAWAYRKYGNWAILRIAVIGIVIGTGIGWATAHIVSDNFVRVLIGVIGFTVSLFFLLRSRANTQATSAGRTAGLFWTTIAGFTGFVSHAGAPPWQVWVLPQKLPKMVFAGTSTFAFAMMNALKIVPYYALGQLQADNLRVMLILFIPAVIAVLVAYKLIRILPERVFYAIVTWTLLFVSIKLIWDGLGL